MFWFWKWQHFPNKPQTSTGDVLSSTFICWSEINWALCFRLAWWIFPLPPPHFNLLTEMYYHCPSQAACSLGKAMLLALVSEVTVRQQNPCDVHAVYHLAVPLGSCAKPNRTAASGISWFPKVKGENTLVLFQFNKQWSFIKCWILGRPWQRCGGWW